MSNIHRPNGWHGLDDDEDSNTCEACWREARTKFFAKRFHKRGETLRSIYYEIHEESHS